MSCFCIRLQKDIVKTLDFRHCSLAFIPPEVYQYDETLEELCLDSNNIKELPRSLFHCQFLRKLSVCDNDLNSVPNAVAGLVNLEQLDISKNGIVELPDSIKCCKNLSLVEISVNPLGKLPEGFTQLVNLTQLYLNDTLLDYLPANFGRLVKLTVLELRENRLKALPRSMARLIELERLDLGMNAFRQIPEVIGFFTKLTELWVDSNKITSIPSSIGNLKELVYLDASCNRIETLPPEIEGLESLSDLHLSKNYLQELPKTIGQLSNLQSLKLDCNQLSSLPYSIGGLVSLEELILTSNDLEELPPSIGLLRKLNHLNVDQNMLLELPAELGSCSSISLLSLQSNFLLVLPDEIGHISNLCVFNLSNNQLRYLPYSTTKLKKLKAMWLSENQCKPLIPLQSEMKEDLGKRVLTCFLFPQQHREPDDDVYPSDGDSFHASAWEEQRLSRRQIAFDVSESDSEHNLKRAPTPYPKEGIKRKFRSPSVPSPSQGRQSTSHSKRDILPNYPSVDMSTRQSRPEGRHEGQPREGKPRRSRSPGTPIADSLHLFQADKEMMAKDKARLRGSISSVSRKDSDCESVASSVRERVVGRREMRARTDRTAMSDTEAFIQSPVWSHTGGKDTNKQLPTQNRNASHNRGYESDVVDSARTPLMSTRQPAENHNARTSQSGNTSHNRGYESDYLNGAHTPLMSTRQPQVQPQHDRTPQSRRVKYSRGYESDQVESTRLPLEEYVHRQTKNSWEMNRNSNAAGTSVDGRESVSRRRSNRRSSGYSTDPEHRATMSSAEDRESRMADVKLKRDQMLPPPYHRVRQLRLSNNHGGPSEPNRHTPRRNNRKSQPHDVKDYGWIDGQLPSTPEGEAVPVTPLEAHNSGVETPRFRDTDENNQLMESNSPSLSRRTLHVGESPKRSDPSALSDTEVMSGRRRDKSHNVERLHREAINDAGYIPRTDRTFPNSNESSVFVQNGQHADTGYPPKRDRMFHSSKDRVAPDEGQDRQFNRERVSRLDNQEERNTHHDRQRTARQPYANHTQPEPRQQPPRQVDIESTDDRRYLMRHNQKPTESLHGSYNGQNTDDRNQDYLNSLNNRRHSAISPDELARNLHPRGSHSLPRDVVSYSQQPNNAFTPDTGIRQSSSLPRSDIRGEVTDEDDHRWKSVNNAQNERQIIVRRSDKKKRLHGGAPDYASSEPELRQHFRPIDYVHSRPPPPETATFENKRSHSQVLQNEDCVQESGRFPLGLPSSTPSVETGNNPSDVKLRSRPVSPTDLPRSRPQSDRESYHSVKFNSYRSSNLPLKPNDRQYNSDYGHSDYSSMRQQQNPQKAKATPSGSYPAPHSRPLTPIEPDTLHQDRRRILSSESDQQSQLISQGPSSKVLWPDLWPQDSSGYASDQNDPGGKRASCSTPTSSVFQGSSAPTTWRPGSDMTPNNRLRRPLSDHHNKPLITKRLPVVIYKNPGLGFSITGGKDAPGNPFSPRDLGIFVTKIQPGGPAEGIVMPGDKILEVNSRSYENIRHDDAVKLLRKSNPVSMLIQRRVDDT